MNSAAKKLGLGLIAPGQILVQDKSKMQEEMLDLKVR